MADDVKRPHRTYRSEQRRRQAAATKQQILEAARERFADSGYYGTTIEAIAREASVAPRTVYASFPTKQDLLGALVEAAIFGEDPPAVSISERTWYGPIAAEPDACRLLDRYAEVVCAVSRRVAPIQRIVRQAASSDARIGAIWERLKEQRLVGQRAIAAMLADRGALMEGLDARSAGDVLWTLTDAALYDDLCERGWTDDRIARWLGGAFRSLLLAALPA